MNGFHPRSWVVTMGFTRKIKIKEKHIMCEKENDQLWKNSWSIKRCGKKWTQPIRKLITLDIRSSRNHERSLWKTKGFYEELYHFAMINAWSGWIYFQDLNLNHQSLTTFLLVLLWWNDYLSTLTHAFLHTPLLTRPQVFC